MPALLVFGRNSGRRRKPLHHATSPPVVPPATTVSACSAATGSARPPPPHAGNRRTFAPVRLSACTTARCRADRSPALRPRSPPLAPRVHRRAGPGWSPGCRAMPRTGSTGLAAAARAPQVGDSRHYERNSFAVPGIRRGTPGRSATPPRTHATWRLPSPTGAAPADRSNSTPDGIARSQGQAPAWW
ncbi:Uncharacterised protein [Mycobacterium tuberculosis]|uniref:Uncharacterized protein n=1 Tax=Mycobacterium tuberculosis TaxID=1773 RepID=A0A654TXQ6_MYCTX|nr:Uncharacterised protein [Mycobacterium tuberculosis]CKT42988.1 Uncharacterised protein [Mycobacterium tuberculosis]